MIEVTHEMIQEWEQAGFEGIPKESLRAACRFLGIEVAAAAGPATLKMKLQKHFGLAPETPTTKEVPRGSFRSPPNFRQLDRWAGRKYRIKVQAPDREHGNRPFPVSWERQVYFLDPRKQWQDVPAPIFHILHNAKKADLRTEWNLQRLDMDREWLSFDRYPYTFLGITPGTEHLPESAHEWFQRDALAHDLYANEREDTLERIWSYLTDGDRPNAKDRDRNIDYWRRQVLLLLELTPEQREARAEMESQKLQEAA